MRSKDGKPPSAEATAQAMKHILAACKRQRVPAGVHCYSGEDARQRIEEGWQFLAIGSELRMMLAGASEALKGLKTERAKEELAKY
jgi:4-hydroxy-2-oxoheptanedioate aldolase